jgi:hypothetical protein
MGPSALNVFRHNAKQTSLCTYAHNVTHGATGSPQVLHRYSSDLHYQRFNAYCASGSYVLGGKWESNLKELYRKADPGQVPIFVPPGKGCRADRSETLRILERAGKRNALVEGDELPAEWRRKPGRRAANGRDRVGKGRQKRRAAGK